MPMDRSLYPKNWEEIATKVKEEADWFCDECGRPCRRPGQSVMDFAFYLKSLRSSPAEIDQAIKHPQRYTLTVAHLDHQPANCDRSNLRALCSVCHLRYDNQFKALKRRLKQERQGQLSLLEEVGG